MDPLNGKLIINRSSIKSPPTEGPTDEGTCGFTVHHHVDFKYHGQHFRSEEDALRFKATQGRLCFFVVALAKSRRRRDGWETPLDSSWDPVSLVFWSFSWRRGAWKLFPLPVFSLVRWHSETGPILDTKMRNRCGNPRRREFSIGWRLSGGSTPPTNNSINLFTFTHHLFPLWPGNGSLTFYNSGVTG